MSASVACTSCGRSFAIGNDPDGATVTCPNCKAVCPLPVTEAPVAGPADAEKDGWITARAPRSAPSSAIVADDLDDAPYDVAHQDADGLSAESFFEAGYPDHATPEPPSPDDPAAVPSIALPGKQRTEALKREWEATATLRTRLWLFLAYETGLLGLALALFFRQESSFIELTVVGLAISALAAYILGTFDRVNLSRDDRGRVVLSKTWRCCFISLGPKKIVLRGYHAVASSANAEREILDWLMLAWLLSLGLLPGILWWIFVFSKPVHQASLAKEHGHPALILYQGVNQEHAHDIAKTVSEVCRYRWRRA